MQTTPRGYPYPEATIDSPNGPAQVQALAVAIDTDVTGLASKVRWQALQTTTPSTILDSSWNTVVMDHQQFNTNGPGLGSGSYRATRPQTVLVAGLVSFPSGSSGSRGARLALNGDAINGSEVLVYSPNGFASIPTATGQVCVLAAGDTISLQGFQNTGVNVSTVVTPNSSRLTVIEL